MPLETLKALVQAIVDYHDLDKYRLGYFGHVLPDGLQEQSRKELTNVYLWWLRDIITLGKFWRDGSHDVFVRSSAARERLYAIHTIREIAIAYPPSVAIQDIIDAW